MARKRKRRKGTKRAALLCPTHGRELEPSSTRFGTRYGCPVHLCTVASWAGSTSTPADQPTRAARIMAHDAFDKLWTRNAGGPKRSAVYRSLGLYMGLPFELTHIGMFNADQCRNVIEFAKDFRRSGATTYAEYKAWRAGDFRDHGDGI